MEKLKSRGVKEWQVWEVQIIVESLIDKIKGSLGPGHLDMEAWRKVADSRILKLAPGDK